jgi:hypothetical protein
MLDNLIIRPILEVAMARWLTLTLGLLMLSLIPANAAQEDPAPPPEGWPNDIPCARLESFVYHIHTHLAIYVEGEQVGIPHGVGIGEPWEVVESIRGPFVTGGSCFSWLHTHTADGILHIESPIPRTFTLGDFFAVWGEPLGPMQVGDAEGLVFAYVNGARVDGDPSDIPLREWGVIQLNVSVDTPRPQPYTFPSPCC